MIWRLRDAESARVLNRPVHYAEYPRSAPVQTEPKTRRKIFELACNRVVIPSYGRVFELARLSPHARL